MVDFLEFIPLYKQNCGVATNGSNTALLRREREHILNLCIPLGRNHIRLRVLILCCGMYNYLYSHCNWIDFLFQILFYHNIAFQITIFFCITFYCFDFG